MEKIPQLKFVGDQRDEKNLAIGALGISKEKRESLRLMNHQPSISGTLQPSASTEV